MAVACRGETIANTDFPLYVVTRLGERHFVVAGGGGQAKTGVPNAVDVFELKRGAGLLVAEKVQHYDCGSAAVMNCALASQGADSLLACGQDDRCHLYRLSYKSVVPKKEGQATEGVRKRKGNLTQAEDYENAARNISVDVQSVCSVRSDFHTQLPFQKAVRLTLDVSVAVTGGADGNLRAWKIPEMTRLYEVKAHDGEIDDLDISPPGNRVVSVSRDSAGHVRNMVDGTKKFDLVWSHTAAYRTRCCRFASVPDRKDEYFLFTAHIPVKREKTPLPCYLTKWETKTYKERLRVSTGTEISSALAVSEDGIYLGVGTIQGSVSVYIAFSLKRLYHVGSVHNIFVTGLDFLPATSSAKTVTGDFDFSLLSISADSQVKLHQLAPKATFSMLWAVLGAVIIIYLVFYLLGTLGI